MLLRRVLGLALLLLLSPIAPSAARADDPWVVTGRTTLPLNYWQGVAFDPGGDAWFDGPVVGLYRTDAGLRQQASVTTGIAPGEPFNHIGDLEWDPREGGRLLLPLECYDPSKTPSNTCGIGALGVADPTTLARRYGVVLRGVPKAMWVALGPDGLLWTQAGDDLLAFSADAVAPGAGTIDAVRRLPGVFHGEADGAAVLDGRLYFTQQIGDAEQRLSSLDLSTGGDERVEATVPVRGESEGLAAFRGLGGALHWVIAPAAQGGPATYGVQSVLLHLNPRGAAVPGSVQHLSPIRLRVSPHRLRRGHAVTLSLQATAQVAGSRVAIGSGAVHIAGRRVALDANGRATVRVRPKRSRLRIGVAKRGFEPIVAHLRVRR